MANVTFPRAASRAERKALWAGPATRTCGLISGLVFVLNATLISRSFRWLLPGFGFGFEAGSIGKWLALTGTYQSPLNEQTGPSAWLSPGYPAFLGFTFKLLGVYSPKAAIAILLVNAMFSAFTCMLLACIAWELLEDRHAPVLASLAVLISPATIYLTAFKVWDTAITGFLAVLCIYCLIRLSKEFRLSWGIATGLAGGALALTNAASAGFLLFTLVLLLLLRSAPMNTRLVSVTAAGLTLICVATPWVLRNHRVFGSWSLRCCSGVELYLGNNAVVWEEGRTQFLASMHPSVNKDEFARYAQLTEPVYDRFCMERAASFISADYERFILMCARRARDFWFGAFEEGPGDAAYLPMTVLNLGALLSIPVISLLGIAGLTLALRQGRDCRIALIFLAIYPIPMYLASVNLRLQYPAQLILIVFATVPIATLVRLLRNDGRRDR
jgi:4-amino-4-deoxy-L-arabinose transferase-like glycosyltransferase